MQQARPADLIVTSSMPLAREDFLTTGEENDPKEPEEEEEKAASTPDEPSTSIFSKLFARSNSTVSATGLPSPAKKNIGVASENLDAGYNEDLENDTFKSATINDDDL